MKTEFFQSTVNSWLMSIFSPEHVQSLEERNQRFFEEATELVQSNNMSKETAHKLVDYVYDRPLGEPEQEVGGVMNTLAALCNALGINIGEQAFVEICRCIENSDKIKAKQKLKPVISDSEP